MIIALGYRIDSPIAIRFRQWATVRLHELIQKGFALEDERLKEGGNRYFKELLQRIRDIRSSERNFYQQVTDVYATATDYDPRADITREFFATVQNKMHYAVHEHTAAEVVYERADSDKPNVGMLTFKGDYVTRDDVRIAKNYLSENELSRLNLLVSQFLDFAEYKALAEEPMSMSDWVAALDDQLKRLRAKLLTGKGKVSHEDAMEKAEHEFTIYRQREMRRNVFGLRRLARGRSSSASSASGTPSPSAPRLPNRPPTPRRHLAQASPAEKALEISSPCNLSTGCV